MLVVQVAVWDPPPAQTRSVTSSSRAVPAPSSPPTPGFHIGSLWHTPARHPSALQGAACPGRRWHLQGTDPSAEMPEPGLPGGILWLSRGEVPDPRLGLGDYSCGKAPGAP